MKKLSIIMILSLLIVLIQFNFIVFGNPDIEDYTTYTEVDPNNRINLVGTDHIDLTTWRNEEAYVYKDMSADYFTDFIHDLDFKGETGAIHSQSYIWGVANDLNSFVWDRDGEWVGIRTVKFYSEGNREIVIEGKPDGAEGGSIQLSLSTWYFLRIVKSETTISCGIYSTSGLRNAGNGIDGDIDNISTTLSSDKSFQYIYACSACNSEDAFEAVDMDIENLNLNEDLELPEVITLDDVTLLAFLAFVIALFSFLFVITQRKEK